MDPSASPPPYRGFRGAVRSAAGWLLLALSLALVSTAIDRTTAIEVYSDGGRIHLEVAGTVLEAQRAIEQLTAVEISAMDSIDPPGGRLITLSDDRGEVLRERLPRRFHTPPGAVVPLGDWELDERAGQGTVWRHDVDVSGAFTLEASFRGRFLHDLTVVLHGDPTTSISIRRGLINDDCFIRDGDGFDLAGTSIDPTPLGDAGALGATLARSGAVACLLTAFFTILQAGFRPHPLPAASPRIPAASLVLALALAAAALSAWVARDVLEALPHTPDAVVYLLQADWFLDGSLWSHVTPIQDYLTLPFTYVDGGRWLAHYPPAWPGLLAIGVAAGAPWLVAPLLGGVYVLLLFLAGRELDGPALGLVAATLGVISPITRLIFGSMLSHAYAATLVLAALVLALRARRHGRWTTATAAGLALGMAFGVRPLTAVAVAVPLLLLALPGPQASGGRDRTRNAVAGFVGGFILAALPALGANELITGNPFSFPYTLTHGSMFGAANIPFGLRNLDALIVSSGAANLGWGWDLFHGPWIIALCFAPALVPLIAKRRRTTEWLLAAMVVSVFVAYRGHSWARTARVRRALPLRGPGALLPAHRARVLRPRSARRRCAANRKEGPRHRCVHHLFCPLSAGRRHLAVPALPVPRLQRGRRRAPTTDGCAGTTASSDCPANRRVAGMGRGVANDRLPPRRADPLHPGRRRRSRHRHDCRRSPCLSVARWTPDAEMTGTRRSPSCHPDRTNGVSEWRDPGRGRRRQISQTGPQVPPLRPSGPSVGMTA